MLTEGITRQNFVNIYRSLEKEFDGPQEDVTHLNIPNWVSSNSQIKGEMAKVVARMPLRIQ